MNTNSILDTIKILLGIDSSYTDFDVELVNQINMVFLELNQLGVGPLDGFMITDSSNEWNDYVEEGMLQNFVRIYIKDRVRLSFDPPSSNALIENLNKEIDMMQFRILVELNRDREEESSDENN